MKSTTPESAITAQGMLNSALFRPIQLALRKGTGAMFYVESPVGMGKTSLLRALTKRFPGSRYLSSDQFTETVVEAILKQRLTDVRRAARKSGGLLLVDDIDFLMGKENSLRELRLWGEATMQRGGVFLVSARCPAKSLKGFPVDVKRWLESAASIVLRGMDMEGSKIFVQRRLGLLPNRVNTKLANLVRENPRAYEGLSLLLEGAQSSLRTHGLELDLERGLRRLT